MLIITGPWREQPPPHTRADLGSAFARTWGNGNAGLWIPGGSNSINGKRWTTGGTGNEPTIVRTQAGLAIYGSGKRVQTDLPAASFSQLSWVAVIQPDAAPNTGGTFTSFFQTGQTTFNWNHTASAYNGAFSLFNSGAFPTCKFTAGFTAGKLEIIGGTYDGTTLLVYRRGVVENGAAAANGLSGVSLNSLQFLGGTGDTASWNGACPFFLWDTGRAYSADEMFEVMGNVWQVFEPRRIIVPAAIITAASHAATGDLAASAATIAGTATHLTLHTSTGALVSGSATIAGTAAHQHAATGALVASEATIAGTAARSSVGTHAATGALAADAATIAGTASHLTLHTATGALVAGSATIAGTARDETTYVEATPVQPAGRPARRVRRVVVEIDGEDFIVDSAEQAAALLDKAKEEAEKRAEVQIQRATKAEKRKPGKVLADARKVLVTPQISAPGLEDYASKIIADIRATYADAMQTIEVAALLRQRDREEEDDEDVLLLML